MGLLRYFFGASFIVTSHMMSSACVSLMSLDKRIRRYTNNVLHRFRRKIKSNGAHAPNGLKEVKQCKSF